jgi:low temperature requirement protein LtrA
VLAAADAYSYLHLILVAGIIVFAVGVKVAVAHPDDPLPEGARLALCGGVAGYLAGLVAFRLRLLGGIDWNQLAGAAGAIAVFAVAGGAHAWVTAAILAVLLTALVAHELITSRA